MSPSPETALAFLDAAISEREQSTRELLGLGTCPEWGHCQPDCFHPEPLPAKTSPTALRRYTADRKLLNLHGGRGHICPARQNGTWETVVQVYAGDEVCPVIQLLAEAYGWTGGVE